MAAATDGALTAAFRDEWGRVVATLIRRLGDWDLAEECAQEAFTEAARRWPAEGVPTRPGAWLTTVAGNRAIDRLRRARRGSQLLEEVGRDPVAAPSGAPDPVDELFREEDPIEDDRLRLMFTCCHPALALEARVALTLKALAGLTTEEIARAFLVPEPTMAKRLTRAKAKIAAAGIPYRVPPAHLLAERTDGVLAVLYLLFNEGYVATSGEDLVRASLCQEAIRLTRALTTLMPQAPEAAGLLALMLLHDARRGARVGPGGELVTLEDQDRGAWDSSRIDEATAVLERALGRGRAGQYQLQAAIAACHATAPSADATDWPQIAALYEELVSLHDSPVVRLNQAVALAMCGESERALAQIDELEEGGALAGYHLLEATRADLLRRAGDRGGAAEAYGRALELVRSAPERRFLTARLAEVEGGA